MEKRTLKVVLLLNVLFAITAALFLSSHVYGITKQKAKVVKKEAGIPTFVSSGLAARAYSDIQLRKLTNLLATKKINTDEVIDKINNLRKKR